MLQRLPAQTVLWSGNIGIMWFLILYLVGLVTGSPLPLDDGCSESVDETIWVPPPASYYGACQHGISRRAWGIADAECDRFWPNGVIQWCYEFPDEFPKWTVPVYNKDNWEEFVTKMMDEGFRDWNGGPEGSIAVSHRGLGQCNQFTTDDLHDKLQMIFNDEKITDSTVGFETHPSMMIDLSLWGASYDELMIGFRHELGHVFGL